MPAISTNGAPSRHIAVVGGGIIGSSTLYYLARNLPAHVRVTLIEEGKAVAPAASGKSGGFLAEDWHGADTADLASLSFRLHRELAEKDGGRDKWGYRNVETLSITFDDGKTRSKAPRDLDWVAGQHVTSCSNMGGGGTTAQATPLPLVEHLVSEAKRIGGSSVEVLCSTRAERVDVDEQGRCAGLVVTDKSSSTERTLDATDVVVAAGPWTGKLLKTLVPTAAQSNLPRWARSAMRIDGSRAHSIVVQAPQPTTAHCLFTDMHYGKQAGAPEVYCRGDGTVYACGGSDSVPLPASADDVGYDAAQTQCLIDQVAHLSPSHLTTKAGATIAREQACYLPIAPRGPVVARDPASRLAVAAGHSCWGITLGLGTGLVMREMLLGEPLSADISGLQ